MKQSTIQVITSVTVQHEDDEVPVVTHMDATTDVGTTVESVVASQLVTATHEQTTPQAWEETQSLLEGLLPK